MGCVASRLEEEEEVVIICRERKKLMKLAVERRYALADAHCRYCHSLYAVSAALKLFVARHSNPTSPFLITFPPPHSPPKASPCGVETVITNPMFLQQNPSQAATTTITQEKGDVECCECECESESESESESSVGSEDDGDEDGGADVGVGQQESFGFYYVNDVSVGGNVDVSVGMPSPVREFGWDFFNPFAGVRPEVMSVGGGGEGGFHCLVEEDLKAVREEEGIPELEEEGGVVGNGNGHVVQESNVVGGGDGGQAVGHGGGVEVAVVDGVGSCNESRGEKELSVVDTPVGGRELLDALKDIEDHFIRAFDSGKQVSKMLEANKMNMQSNLDEIKENSTKLIQSITWHRSNISRSPSCKSLVASSSKNSSTWTEYKNDLFDDYGGMTAGSHSLTLGRLYAWEKKLYEEVKAGDNIRKLYERKCAHLRNKDVRGEDTLSVDKTRAAVKDLYSRILVAIRRAESISVQIQKLADEELQPQIIELLQGMTESWKIMMESHETQSHIIFEVKTFDCPSYGKFCNDSHRLATLQLEAEIQNWRECFTEYIAAQRAYVEALHGWLSKFLVPEVEFGSRAKNGFARPPYRANGPLLYRICRDWLTFMENLPDKAVTIAMKSFIRDVRALWVQQGEEQDQKGKVDRMAKEFERKMTSYHKVEGRILQDTKLLEYKTSEVVSQVQDDDSQQQADYLTEKKESLENFKRRLELEKEKHHNSMQDTQRTTLNGFQTGFSLIFDSMVQFSNASLKMYSDLMTESQKSEKAGNPTSVKEGSYVTEHPK
ncbi:hypothetical protein vseg_018557 [Gypsophila vaccaria]